MQSTPNWSALYAKGRCKAVGISWSDEELNAVYELHIPVEYVRNGCKTLEEYEEAKNQVEYHEKEKGEKPLRYMNKFDLVKLAVQCGENVTDDVTRNDLISLIEVVREKKFNSEAKLAGSDAGALQS